MRIEFLGQDGSRTVARWGSIALLHWLWRFQPRKEIESPEFGVYVVGQPVPGDTHPMFLVLVYAEIERRWNKMPPFEIMKPESGPEQPKDDPFCYPPGGQEYQDRCLEVLVWLRQEGDVVELLVEGNRPETIEDMRRIFPGKFPEE